MKEFFYKVFHTRKAKIVGKPESLFKKLVLDRIDINNPVMDNQEYPWRVFWLDVNGKYICEWDYRYESFYFNYYVIWKVFEDELNLKYGEIQAIMRSMVEEHLGLREVTPWRITALRMRRVEEHFGLKRITPHQEQTH